VILETIDPGVLPESLRAPSQILLQLGQVYKQIEAPFGRLAQDALLVSTFALESNSTNDATYTQLESDIESWTSQRDSLGAKIKAMLDEAEFDGKKIDEKQAETLISQGRALLGEAAFVVDTL
jgi:hypothetical protein